MQHTLFEILSGSFAHGRPLGLSASDDDQLISIENHLERLFNTRQESVSHLQSYGLPDTAGIFSGLPYTAPLLADLIQQNIKLFEPRLTNIQVRHLNEPDAQNRLQYEIRGTTVHGVAIKARASFSNGNGNEVRLSRLRRDYA